MGGHDPGAVRRGYRNGERYDPGEPKDAFHLSSLIKGCRDSNDHSSLTLEGSIRVAEERKVLIHHRVTWSGAV